MKTSFAYVTLASLLTFSAFVASAEGTKLASFRSAADSFGEEASADVGEPVDRPVAHGAFVQSPEKDAEDEAPIVAEKDPSQAPAPEATAEASPADTLARIESSLHDLEERMTSRKATLRTKEWEWEDLSRFQRALWRAMALDPADVAEHLIPTHIHPRYLTGQLRTELDRLVRARDVAVKYNVEEEFDAYVSYCQQVLDMRDEGLFRRSRVDAKRGVLEDKYLALADKLTSSAGLKIELGVAWDEGDRRDVLSSLAEVREEVRAFRSDVTRLPASVVSAERVSGVKTLLWVLIPLVFATGFLGGLVFRKSE
jgi:hypothetical protein